MSWDSALEPHAIGEVLETLVKTKPVIYKDGFDFENQDLNYLGERSNIPVQNIKYAIAEFGEPVVLESLRRLHGLRSSVRVFFGVCRNVGRNG